MEKYIGCRVDIIYQDRKGKFSKRRIHVLAVRNGIVHAFCTLSGAPRSFREDHILAIQVASRTA